MWPRARGMMSRKARREGVERITKACGESFDGRIRGESGGGGFEAGKGG